MMIVLWAHPADQFIQKSFILFRNPHLSIFFLQQKEPLNIYKKRDSSITCPFLQILLHFVKGRNVKVAIPLLTVTKAPVDIVPQHL